MASVEERYRQFFLEADADGSGQLSLDELIAILRKKGYKESDEKIKAMFDAVDDSGDHLISYEEYMKAMGQMEDKDHKAAAARRVFREFDKNGDGEIDRNELDAVFKELGMHVPQDEIDRIIKEADRDGSKTLNYDEFIREVYP